MRNQRLSSDEDRNFGHRSRERGGNCDEGFQNHGQGEEWRFQGKDEGRLESEQQWRGGQSGQSARLGQGGYREYDQGIGERDYSGMGRGMAADRQEPHDRMFDQADRRSSEHDEDFDSFRTNQMNELDGRLPGMAQRKEKEVCRGVREVAQRTQFEAGRASGN